MKVRGEKMREYHIDSKQITAKKGRKNNDSFTPNSLSTSHNHHKYEKCDEAGERQRERESITAKQFEAVARSLHQYCKKKPNESLEAQLRKNELARKLYQYLRARYRVVGERDHLDRIETFIREFLPQRERTCERCGINGSKCNYTHLKYLNDLLPEDIENLERKLEDLESENDLCLKILQHKNSFDNKESTVQELKSIIEYQERTLKQLQEKEGERHEKNGRRAKLEIFIDEEQN